MSKEYVLVPKEDIEKVEEARLAMFHSLESKLTNWEMSCFMFDIGGAFWHITNRKYHTINIEESTIE